MKKYEMLEKAMRDYPKGTVARFKSAPNAAHISDGVFRWIFDSGNGDCIVSGDDKACFYASDTDEWAIPVNERAFIMQSHDGVNLYEGDDYYRVCDLGNKGRWTLVTVGGSIASSGKLNLGLRFMQNDRIFSTKKAAEKWIEKQNKLKAVECKLFKGKTANIHPDLIRVFDGNNTMNLAPSDLEDMLHAYKQLTK